VSAPVDRVARGHFEGKVAAPARLDPHATRQRDDAGSVEDAIVQPPLLQVVRLAGVPVLVGGEEAFEEVDPLEVGLLRHLLLPNQRPVQQLPPGPVMSNRQFLRETLNPCSSSSCVAGTSSPPPMRASIPMRPVFPTCRNGTTS